MVPFFILALLFSQKTCLSLCIFHQPVNIDPLNVFLENQLSLNFLLKMGPDIGCNSYTVAAAQMHENNDQILSLTVNLNNYDINYLYTLWQVAHK